MSRRQPRRSGNNGRRQWRMVTRAGSDRFVPQPAQGTAIVPAWRRREADRRATGRERQVRIQTSPSWENRRTKKISRFWGLPSPRRRRPRKATPGSDFLSVITDVRPSGSTLNVRGGSTASGFSLQESLEQFGIRFWALVGSLVLLVGAVALAVFLVPQWWPSGWGTDENVVAADSTGAAWPNLPGIDPENVLLVTGDSMSGFVPRRRSGVCCC